MSSLLIASQNGNLDVVEYLCSLKGIKIDDKSSNVCICFLVSISCLDEYTSLRM